jgi:NADH:ubiquinone reductase (non-electrogenic)
MFWDCTVMKIPGIMKILIHIGALICLQVKALTLQGTSLITRPFRFLTGTRLVGDSTRKTVCIVGGGFGGLYSALSIARSADANTDVFLIDPKESFVFLPLLYELAVGTATSTEVEPTYESLFRSTKVKFLRAAVSSVDFDAKVCSLTGTGSGGTGGTVPSTLAYDKLVLAVGVQSRTDLIAGARQHSLPFYTAEHAHTLKTRLVDLRTKLSKQGSVSVAVIGGGYSGVEVAVNVAQHLGRGDNGDKGDKGGVSVTIVERNQGIMRLSPAHNRITALRSLERCGVHTSCSTSVQAVEAGGLRLSDAAGERFLPADLVLFTAGTQQGPLVQSLTLAKDRFGRIITGKTLQSERGEVFALGDCAAVAGSSDPCTAQVAMQQSYVLAKNVLRSIKADRKRGKGGAGGAGGAGGVDGDKLDSNGAKGVKQRGVSGLSEFSFLSLGEMLTLYLYYNVY